MPDYFQEVRFLELPTISDLPPSLEREIGRVIIWFARLEWILSKMLFAALNIKPVTGRIAIKDHNAVERFEIIKRLAILSGLNTTKTDLGAIKAAICAAQSQRNDLAHSVWMRMPAGDLVICYTRGERDDDLGGAVSKSRKVAPEGAAYSAQLARSVTALIDRTIKALDEWNAELVLLQPSRDKPAESRQG